MKRATNLVCAAMLAGVGVGIATPVSALPLQRPAVTIDVVPAATCFYADGWNGPGLYECGYRLDRGMGWLGKIGRGPKKSGMHKRRPNAKQRR